MFAFLRFLICLKINKNEFSFCRENAFRKLKRALKKLWKNFLSSISSSVSDYLSVEHLGLILKRLAEKGINFYISF